MQCVAPWKSSAAWRERNAGIPEDRRIEFRIGINVGDIIIDEDDIYGDGVNIAARLEALASPARSAYPTMPISRSRDKLALDVSDMGEQQLKNIAQPVRVYRRSRSIGADDTTRRSRCPTSRRSPCCRSRT